jgi:hypothetical protein
MTSVRLRTCVAGGALALTAGVLADQGSAFGADLPHIALLGAALGAVIGLVPDRSLAGRIGGFLAGFVAAWLGYALRAGVLPDIPMGRAIAAVAVVAVITAVTVATNGRIPLWSGLVGVGGLLGAYESTFTASPASFLADSVTAVTTVLVAGAFGILVSTLAEDVSDVDEAVAHQHGEVSVPAPRSAVDADVSREVSR